MNTTYNKLVLKKIQDSDLWVEGKSNITDYYINNLKCPVCKKIKAFAYVLRPYVIICNRKNECGEHTPVKELFTELANFDVNFPIKKDDALRPATAYLHSRGLNNSLLGLNFEYWPNIRNTGSGGVMFPITDKAYNGRIFNPPIGVGKTHNKGSTMGKFWKHPTIEYKNNVETYVTEGIIDSLSLLEIGKQAIAVISASQKPEKICLDEFSKLVFAFDSDAAGIEALHKWKKEYPDAKAIITPRYISDWNEWLQNGDMEENFDKLLLEMKIRAELILAPTLEEYLKIYTEYYNHNPGLFEFKGRYFYNNVPVSDFTIKPLYDQFDKAKDYSYILQVCLRGKKTIATIKAEELVSAQTATTWFAKKTKGIWTGNKQETAALARLVAHKKKPIIYPLEVTGIDKESNWYFLKYFGINPNGNYIPINDLGVIPCTKNNYIKPADTDHNIFNQVKPKICNNPELLIQFIYDVVKHSYGNDGILALTWAIASWFLISIKDNIGFFPFLQIWGIAGSGKSTLLQILNGMQGVRGEGYAPKSTDTTKGTARILSTVSALFIPIRELTSCKKLDQMLDMILSAYNNDHIGLTAKFSNDNKTNSYESNSTILFSQNANIVLNSPKQYKERVITLHRTKQMLEKTPEEYVKIIEKEKKKGGRLTPESLVNIFIAVMQKRKHIQSVLYDKVNTIYEEYSNQYVGRFRLCKTYALLMAFHELMKELFGVSLSMDSHIHKCLKEHIEFSDIVPETDADTFFAMIFSREFVPYVDEIDDKLYIRVESIPIYLNITTVNSIQTLKKAMKEHLAFIKMTSHRFPNYISDNEGKILKKDIGKQDKTLWCAVFDSKKLKDWTL